MRSLVLAAGLLVATAASAQSSLTLPNNSAGTPLDTPPVAPAAKDVETMPRTFDALDTARRGYLTREDFDKLQQPGSFDAADANRDGRVDAAEFERFNKPSN